MEAGKIGAKAFSLFSKYKDFSLLASSVEDFLSSKSLVEVTGKFPRIGLSLSDDFLNGTKSLPGVVSDFLGDGLAAKTGSLLGKFGRIAGPVLAPLAIAGGIHDMISPEHDGWRGGGDRVAGGMSVIAGGGTLLMAAGLLTNPVGIGIVVGVGAVAGAWALGNMVADSAWGKAAGHWISETASTAWHGTTAAVGNAVDGATHAVGSAVDGATHAVGSAVDGARHFLANPVKSLGGLFG